MGDRVSVNITISKNSYKKLLTKVGGTKQKLIEALSNHEPDDIQIERDSVTFTGYEVNYAEWECLEKLLQEHKVPYDKDWEAGCEFESGRGYYRNVPDKWIYHEVYHVQIHIAEALQEVLVEANIEEAIRSRLKRIYPFEITELT